MTIGQIIKELRKQNKLTQTNLAKAIGYGHAIIGFWENDENQPTAEAIYKLAIYFDVSADYLLGITDEYGNKINNTFLKNKNNYNIGVKP